MQQYERKILSVGLKAVAEELDLMSAYFKLIQIKNPSVPPDVMDSGFTLEAFKEKIAGLANLGYFLDEVFSDLVNDYIEERKDIEREWDRVAKNEKESY